MEGVEKNTRMKLSDFLKANAPDKLEIARTIARKWLDGSPDSLAAFESEMHRELGDTWTTWQAYKRITK